MSCAAAPTATATEQIALLKRCDVLIEARMGTQQFVVQRSGSFLGKTVATQLAEEEGREKVAVATVSSLATLVPTADIFVPPADALLSVGAVTTSGVLLQGKRIGGTEPRYPIASRREHLTGAGVVACGDRSRRPDRFVGAGLVAWLGS